jgi:hypothetical protein
MTRPTRQRIHDLMLHESRQKYPNLPDHARVVNIPTDGSANGLTKLVIKWIELHGGQAERINTMGRMVDKRKIVTDVLGRKGMIGSMSYIPTTGTKGSADVSAVVQGRSYKIEIKVGKDRQSDAQKAYEQSITSAGGVYLIVRTMDQFVQWWDENIKP